MGLDLVHDLFDNLGDVVAAVTLLAIALGILFVAFKYGKRSTSGRLSIPLPVPWKRNKVYGSTTDLYEAVGLTKRAHARIGKGEYEQAIADSDEAIRLQPTLAEAFNARGRAWGQKKEYDKALTDYAEAIRLQPKLASAYSNRGVVWQAMRELDKALVDLSEAIHLDPRFAAAFSNRGHLWIEVGQYDKAVEDCSEAIRLNPKLATAYNNRGLAWIKKSEWVKAIDDCTTALRRKPESRARIGQPRDGVSREAGIRQGPRGSRSSRQTQSSIGECL